MLDVRVLRPELMDDPGLSGELHREALVALARINRLSGVVGTLWGPLRELLGDPAGRPLRLLDLGSGGGDVPLGLAARAAHAGLPLQVVGSDVSPRAVAFASERARQADLPVGFRELDALAGPLPEGHDVVMCSLMLHHLDDAQAASLLAAMGLAARRAVIVSDLARGPAGLALAWAGTRLLTRCPVVHVDGVRSVRAALRPDEALAMAVAAGLPRPRVRRRWPCRWLLTSTRA